MKPNKIDNVEYIYVVDEGFAPGWMETIQQTWPTYNGPFYIYPTPDPVTTIVTNAPLNEMQLIDLNYPDKTDYDAEFTTEEL